MINPLRTRERALLVKNRRQEDRRLERQFLVAAAVLSQRAKQAKVSVDAYLEAETIDCDPTPEPALSSTRRKGGKGKKTQAR